MKCRLAAGGVRRAGAGRRRTWRFLPGNHEGVAAKQDANALRGNACEVHDDFDAVLGLDDIERRMALAGIDAMFGRQRRVEVGEELPEVAGEVARLSRGNDKRKLGHGGHHRMPCAVNAGAGPRRNSSACGTNSRGVASEEHGLYMSVYN